MAVKNDKLGGTNYSNGDVLEDAELNDTNDVLIDQFVTQAELGVRILQSNDVFTNGPNFVVDEFTDSDGTNNTVNTGSTTQEFLTDKYFLTLSNESSGDSTTTTGTWSNVSNAFDDDDTTFADETADGNSASIGTTFSQKYISWVKIKYEASDNAAITTKLQTYNGSTWDDVETLGTSNSQSVENLFLVDSSVQGVRLSFSGNLISGINVYQISYGTFTDGQTVVVDSGTTSLDGNEAGFVVSLPDSTILGNTSIDVTIGDGTNTLNAQTIDSGLKGVVVGNNVNFGGPLSSGALELTITSNTTDTRESPVIKDYGVKILR